MAADQEEKIEKKEDTQSPNTPVAVETPSLPPQIEDFLNQTKAPPSVKKIIAEMGMGSFQVMEPSVNPIVRKLSAQHIDKLLDYSHDDEQNSYKLESHGRWFHLGYALLIVAFLVFLVVFLAKENAPLFSDILKILAVFAGGFGGGFGWKTYLDRKK